MRRVHTPTRVWLVRIFPRQRGGGPLFHKERFEELEIHYGRSGQIKPLWLIDVSFVPLCKMWWGSSHGCQMSAGESLAKLIWFTSCVDGAIQMICLTMAIINHRQPEGTANTHGKESGLAHRSTRGLCMGWAHVYKLYKCTLCQCVCCDCSRVYLSRFSCVFARVGVSDCVK